MLYDPSKKKKNIIKSIVSEHENFFPPLCLTLFIIYK